MGQTVAERFPLRVGGVSVSSPVWLAPLAGITTETFRWFHRAIGAGLVHTEMVSVMGLSYRNRKTARMLGEEAEPGPLVLQLFGPDAESMVRGAELALGIRCFDALEVNMACPMPKVAKKGSGAALLLRPETAREMVTGLKRFDVPVWVKLRITDPARHPLPTADFCALLLDAGADLLMLHGRTPAQRYEGTADKDAVCGIAGRFPGLLVASGDVYAPEDAVFYLERGCVAVLAARGTLRDAFLIPRTLAALGYSVEQSLLEPETTARIDAMLAVARHGLLREGESPTLVLLRRMLPGLFRGFSGASAIRQACSACREWPALEETLLRMRGAIGREGRIVLGE
jgi:tRNA-dihydrouridine synthase